MGLFGPSKADKEYAEKKVKEALADADILNDIMHTLHLKINDASWILKCTGYYDTRNRTILVGPDLLSVSKGLISFENGEPQEPKDEYLNFSYTASGYRPLHGYTDSKGNLIFDESQVVALWLDVLRERLMHDYPDIHWANPFQHGKYAVLQYKVAPLEWKDWF